MEHLTPRERQLLSSILRLANEYGDFPSLEQIIDDLGEIDSHNASTIIGRLKNKGYLLKQKGRPLPTEDAKRVFPSNNNTSRLHNVVPTQIKVAGSVQAGGNRKPEELVVNVDDDFIKVLVIPETNLEKKTYALEVIGNSMEHEGILEGDFVIVEDYDVIEHGINTGDMIVTKYYPLDLEPDDQDIDIPETDYFGLTLKIIAETKSKNNRTIYRLGWKKDNLSNPYLIWASRLIPKARVIGVYRNLRGK